jgi:hypothetical protein
MAALATVPAKAATMITDTFYGTVSSETNWPLYVGPNVGTSFVAVLTFPSGGGPQALTPNLTATITFGDGLSWSWPNNSFGSYPGPLINTASYIINTASGVPETANLDAEYDTYPCPCDLLHFSIAASSFGSSIALDAPFPSSDTATGFLTYAIANDLPPGVLYFSVTGINVASTVPDPSSAVPEPSTWAMMLLGFAGLGFAFRQSLR